MISNRATAIIVGILFLTSTAAIFIGGALIESYFIDKPPDKTLLIIGVLLEAYCGVAVAGIGVLMFPLLKPHNEKLALGYVVFRILELVVIIIGEVITFTLLTYNQDYYLLVALFTGIGGLMFCYLLYQSKLVPRFISVLGFVGYAMLVTALILEWLGYSIFNFFNFPGVMFYLPGIAFEITLPVWLIVKGFISSMIASESVKTDIN
ncbi:hypothetical protein LCGC14_0508490 [marine sediment metagenome]|uniref:DUF4386 domain-containing protein n=1 Tax=marine sediment metagenome TaxID=412755 RepID=A0A0F9VAG2_9ZZZZ